MWRNRILPFLVGWLYRLWTATWRIELIVPPTLQSLFDQKSPIIFAHWHGDELAIVTLVSRLHIATMTSTSRDGNLIDSVIRQLGGATSRGSSTRGGSAALRGLIRLIRKGFRASMAVDGPKGPLHIVKPGVFELSRLAPAAIVPVGVGSSHTLIFHRSWNKAVLPKPFARVTVAFGEPFPPLSQNDDPRAPALADRLSVALSDAHNHAAKLIADSRRPMLASKGF